MHYSNKLTASFMLFYCSYWSHYILHTHLMCDLIFPSIYCFLLHNYYYFFFKIGVQHVQISIVVCLFVCLTPFQLLWLFSMREIWLNYIIFYNNFFQNCIWLNCKFQLNFHVIYFDCICESIKVTACVK